MPTYEYECEGCGAHFERFQQMSDAPVRKCPECGRRRVRRLLGAGIGIITRSASQSSCDLRCGADRPCPELDGPCGGAPCGL